MKQPPLKALRVFESVARRGSFKDAADELCVSQSAISHQIKHLENWLGRPLFDRTGHRPQLLEHAKTLSTALERSFKDIDTACEAAQINTSSGTLVIAAIPSVAICWLIPRLSDFRSKHPDITTRVVYAFHGQDVDLSEVDLMFMFANNPPTIAGHKSQLFQSGASVPVCSPSLYDSLNLAELPNSIITAGLLHDANIEGWTEWFSKKAPQTPSSVTGPIFEDFNLLRAAVLAGQGVALCPLALIRADIASKRLVQLSEAAIKENYNYYLINRDKNNADNVAARTSFANWVFEMGELDSPQ